MMNVPILKKVLAVIAFSLLAISSVSAQRKSVDFKSELGRLFDINLLPSYVEGTVVKQISSYDTTGGNDDGFGGKYSFIREEPNGGLVIFDETGQGVIERIWTPTPTDDTLDFYFDGSSKPSLSIKFRDLFNNSQAPFLAPVADQKVGGFYSYIPIPYEKSCKIVFRGEKILFHQIQFRSYDQNYQVQTYDQAQTAKERPLLDKILDQWSKKDRSISDFSDKPSKAEKKMVLQPGKSEKIFELNSGGRILGIELTPAEVFSGDYKQIDLKITWDDEKKPAVYVPVADFFGFASGSPSMESLLLGAKDNKAYSYIPMPFDRNARVELVYRAGNQVKPVELFATVYYSNRKRDEKNEGRFYAHWKNENPALGSPFVFLEGKGKGHYVGTIMQGQATDYKYFTEFFEGDDYTEIDGKMTVHGTGSEDYFNGGWYAQPGGWVERLGAPLTGCLEYSLPLGRTGGYRLFINDKMPFNTSILHTIEHGPENNNRKVNYISVAMYYAENSIAQQRQPVNELTKVFMPDTMTFYSGLMDHLTFKGNMERRDGAIVFTKKGEGDLFVDVSEIPLGQYQVYMHKRNREHVNIRVMMPQAKTWETIKGRNEKNGDVLIGVVSVSNNENPVKIQLVNSDDQSDLIFDRVTFAKINQ